MNQDIDYFVSRNSAIESSNIKQREIPLLNDDLHFYKGRIYKSMQKNDDRLQIRILPHMLGVPASELENLPRYPCFFKGEVLQGFTEVEDGENKASLVYVLTTSDFQYGYVMGLANQFEGASQNTILKDSYGYNTVRAFLRRRGIFPKNFQYQNIVVQTSSTSDQGGIIELYNFRTGEKVILLSSGTAIVLMNDRIIMRVGSPKEDGSCDAFSAITMTNNKILMQAKNGSIEFDAPSIVFGHHGHNLVGSIGSNMAVSVDGMNFTGVSTISV